MTRVGLGVLLLLPLAQSVLAAGNETGHHDPIAPVILGVTGILFFALIGRHAARTLGQPSVLGELIVGVVLGNVGFLLGSELITVLREGSAVFDLFGLDLRGLSHEEAAREALGDEVGSRILSILESPQGLEIVRVAHAVDTFSRYGVIFLLFMVGLDMSLGELEESGPEAIRVAILGVIAPFLLGLASVELLLPDTPMTSSLFIAATLCATSVGITARVLKDMGRGRSDEAHVILGAAVVDDVLGLILLSIVSGIAVAGGVEAMGVIKTILLAVLFLGGAVLLGPYLVRAMVRLLATLDLVEAKMFCSFLFVMVMAWVATFAGLAAIIGAFAAGVILSDAYFHRWVRPRGSCEYSVKDLIAPLEVILVPIFFVLMGLQVKLESFMDWRVVTVAGVLVLAAVIGKLVSGIGAGRNVNRLSVGIGMTPRGEVGLIFAALGKGLGVIDDALFSALVLMVILTTLLTPPFLKLVMAREPGTAPDS